MDDLLYSNERLPGVSTPAEAIDYLIAVMYPNYIGTFPTKADLPVTANPNDYAIVSDDGDGKSAGYVWVVHDGVAQWMKRYDVDWSMDDILAETVNVTMPMYVKRDGFDDRDADGNPVTGLYAGQKIYGGASTNTNFTFNANSADNTGYVQTDNHFRPTSDNSIDLGTPTERFREAHIGTELTVDTLSISAGSITDTSGTILFGDNDLATTGLISSTTLDVSLGATIDTLTLQGGSITDSSGTISFGDENLVTTGNISGANGSSLGSFTFGNGTISSTTPGIDFGDEDLTTVGTLSSGDATLTKADIDNISIDGNSITATNPNGSLILSADGTGFVDIVSDITAQSITASGSIAALDVQGGNLKLQFNSLISTNANGNIVLDPNGTGVIVPSASLIPDSDAVYSLGSPASRYSNLYFSGVIGDGVTSITNTTLQSIRDINVGVTTGMSIFWDGSQWLPSLPDTEITHGTLSGLTTGDAGHTQFVMLTGRAGGQTIQGGTAPNETLVLESTSDSTKGPVLTKDHFRPFTNASFSVTWSGTDLGGGSNCFRDIYMKGEGRGFRVENFTFAGLPSPSASSPGRIAYGTDTQKIYVDNGTTWLTAGVSKYLTDTVWNGTDLTKTITVSNVTDARNCIIQFLDNSNNFDRIYATTEALNATQVRITTNVALPAGSYRLIVME